MTAVGLKSKWLLDGDVHDCTQKIRTVGTGGVSLLTGRVGDQVHGPTEDLPTLLGPTRHLD